MPNTEQDILQDGIPEITLTVEVQNTVQAPVDETLSIRGQAADAYETGQAIANMESTINTAIALLFPVGAIYCSLSSTPPAFYGTWVEILIPMTHGDIEDGTRSYEDLDEQETGTLHFWRRTA